MESQQVFNPFLPSYEYVPDGEPHVFGDRVYLYGSHDRFNGESFCLNDYICYSAPISDLSDWKYEGVIFPKRSDPRNENGSHSLFAPDVARGLDGKYYLYYCLDCLPLIGVAMCDTPAGAYEFMGFVRHRDGIYLGERKGDLFQFDPGILIDDDGEIYLYSGNAPRISEFNVLQNSKGHASQVMNLEPDMLTLKSEPKLLMPDIYSSKGTGFEGHEFFEASSVRKINNKYYFIYSSVNSHELNYAVSNRPDTGYKYGGTIVDIGDVYLNGRSPQDSLNYLGNTHGSIECIAGNWYVFYHRQTNRHMFSRQACAERLSIDSEGCILQAELTSCGLNGKPLRGIGRYEARIACHLRGREGAKTSRNQLLNDTDPYFTQDGEDREERPDQHISNINEGTQIGFRYFDFTQVPAQLALTVSVRGKAKGSLAVKAGLRSEAIGELELDVDSEQWERVTGKLMTPMTGACPLYFVYSGEGSFDMITFELIPCSL